MTENQYARQPGWNFDNSYAKLPALLYTKLEPTPVRAPAIAVLNEPLANELGLDANALRSEAGAETFAGNRIPEGAAPLAQAYAGHQFGHFNRLGDGRALLLGEQITPRGERFDIHLKGSGPTPYSRNGDGRAALGPMLREYIISEAMNALRIPTTRILAVAATGEPVYRETALPGAVLTRVASSHLRVGTFQYAAVWGTTEELRVLADYALQRHDPELVSADGNRYLALLHAVIERQASLIAKWQLVGFIHGVMNTDNMTISGETIDYGPCAFMDAYDPATVFSSIDTYGRYAYGNQPSIGGWNLARFAETLLPLLHPDEEEAIRIAEGALAGYAKHFNRYWLGGMRAKLGLAGEDEGDEALIEDLLGIMQKVGADYTNTFRELTLGTRNDEAMFGTQAFAEWQQRWQRRTGSGAGAQEEAQQLMKRTNPAIIPRNHRVEEALEAAVRGDYAVMERLLAVLARPFDYSPEQEAYASLPACATGPYRTFCGT